jgi:hypothetical protein
MAQDVANHVSTMTLLSEKILQHFKIIFSMPRFLLGLPNVLNNSGPHMPFK